MRLSARARGYDSRWQAARRAFLRSHPFCVACSSEGRHRQAEHVHHSTPHRGDQRIFWDRSRWVPLCQEHHNRDAQQSEVKGYANRVDASGLPTDGRHPFYAGGDDRGAYIGLTRGGAKVQADKGSRPHGISAAELVSVMSCAASITFLAALVAGLVG